MKVTVNIQTKKTELKRAVTFYHRSNSANIEFEGGYETSMNGMSGLDVVSFIEKALQETILRMVERNVEEPADVTITGATLTEGAKSFLTDKFTSDPIINSIQFE